MRDPYCVGFWISTILAISAIGIYFTGIWFNYDLDKAFAYLNAVGTVIAGLAGLFVAGVTLYGLKLWRLQLYGTKYLTVIWDAQAGLRLVEGALIRLQVDALTLGKNATDKDLSRLISESSFKSAIMEFKEKCQVLDRIVVKNEWQWSNYAAEIENNVHQNLKSALHFKSLTNVEEQMKSISDAADQISKFNEFIRWLNQKLDKLESKHGIHMPSS
ncbi:hypothetical protein [Pseudomonas oryzihabitans]|uniref:DUF4760 domain-containing protein n=1 Tax=Pseudomonas oryzihabitans TaxID=47885 RepID=A0ABX3IPY1_9PSED|nr:hypothetical protein [Pseudomonas psychrotolerans]ONN69884.1 hypothetical protein BVL52_16550 [Pseudomonas psychrotolerans]